MIAADTNVWVRILTGDDPEQVKRALQALRGEQIFIPKTVFLEMEWVMRSVYGLDRGAIAGGFRRLLGLAEIRIESETQLVQALVWYDAGLDFADALHVAASGEASRFVTFDKELSRAAEKLGVAPTVSLA